MIKLKYLIFLCFVLWGCQETNKSPSNSSTMAIDLESLQIQIGINSQTTAETTTPTASETSSEVKALIVGAMLVTKSETAYSANVPLSSQLESDLQSQLAKSIKFFSSIELPTDETYLEFDIPSDSAAKWQIVAIAGSQYFPDLVSLTAALIKESILYYGFSDTLLENADVTLLPVEITMKRACLGGNTPKGCAIYDEDKNGVITADVEIVDVSLNGQPIAIEFFPLIVREAPDSSRALQVTPDQARTILEGIIAGESSIQSLSIRTTHLANPSESQSCRDMANATSPSAAELAQLCEVQEYSMLY